MANCLSQSLNMVWTTKKRLKPPRMRARVTFSWWIIRRMLSSSWKVECYTITQPMTFRMVSTLQLPWERWYELLYKDMFSFLLAKYLGVDPVELMELFHNKKSMSDRAVGCPCLWLSTIRLIALYKAITWALLLICWKVRRLQAHWLNNFINSACTSHLINIRHITACMHQRKNRSQILLTWVKRIWWKSYVCLESGCS